MTSTGTKRWAGLLLAAIAPAAAIDNGLGRVPPFGWRSWNCFHGNVNQSNIERQVDALVKPNQNASWGEAGKSLLDFGYASIGLDDNWQACGAGVNGSFHNIDGTPLINQKTFPDMAGMVEYGHAKDVKMGFYINNCICKEEGLSADFADKVYSATSQMISDQNWDGVKIDSCSQFHRLDTWANDIAAHGKPVMIENCHNNMSYPFRDGAGKVQCPANFFRVSSDINPSWEKVTQNLQCTVYWNKLKNPISQPGCFPYPDMLEVGNGKLNYAQSRSHFAAWVMVSSPLILGMDLTNRDTMGSIWNIIANEEVLNISRTFHLHPGFLVTSGNPDNAAAAAAATPTTQQVAMRAAIQGYVWAVPADSNDPAQKGWSWSQAAAAVASGGALRHGAFCLAAAPAGVHPSVDFAFVDCDGAEDQNWTFEANGNLHLAASSHAGRCVASKDWSGPDVVAAICTTGSNEVWSLDSKTGTLCSGGNAVHPERCLAFNAKSPAPNKPRAPFTVPASWQVYAKPQPDNKFAVLLFNMNNISNDVSIDVASLGFTGPVEVRDVWRHAALPASTGTIVAFAGLEAYDSALVMLTPTASEDKTPQAHPFTKISPAWAAKINATQVAAYTAGEACSYRTNLDWTN